jgi:sugar transferase (PEP-CTERM/EpsH1 system associated)
MKILVLSPTFPLPLNVGDKIRIYHTIKGLSLRNNITLVSLAQNNAEMKWKDSIESFCSTVYVIKSYKRREIAAMQSMLYGQEYRVAKFRNRQFKYKVCEFMKSETFDIIWVNFLNMAIYLDPELIQDKIVLLDQHNAEELVWERYTRSERWIIRQFARWNLRNLKQFQNKVLGYFDILLAVSELEAQFMRNKVSSGCKVWVVPNGVDINYFRPSFQANKMGNVILLCGSMDITMNIEAALRFAREIFPAVKSRVASAEFWIVGRKPDKKVQNLSEIKGIRVIGAVEDVRPYYAQAKVVVAPYHYGAGTKLKIIEAMATGVPIVSTEVGIQGIEARPGEHLLIENENNRISECVVELLRNEKLRIAFSSAGRKLVEDKYSWTSIVKEAECRLQMYLDHKNLK